MFKKYGYPKILGLLLIFILILGFLYFRSFIFTGGQKVTSQDIVSLPISPLTMEEESTTKLTIKKEAPALRKYTRIPLRVLGVYLGETHDKHFAVIKNTKTGHQGFYKIGDKIEQFTIKEISFVQVLLERESTHERIILAVEGNGINFEEKGEALAECLSPTECFVRRNVLKKKAENINELLQEAKALPVIDNGVIKGFKIQDVTKEGIAEQLGLREGDVIKAVNDERLDDLTKPFVIYNKYRNSPFINVEIEREGRELSVLYKIR